MSQFLFMRARLRDNIPALFSNDRSNKKSISNYGTFKIERSNKKASLVEYVDKNFSQFLFMRARDNIPALSKILNFPDNT